MAYSYTRSKFNFAQNILTVQRTGRIPFTIIFAQFFHKFIQPKVTSYWLYQCPRLTPSPPLPKFCMIIVWKFSWVLQSSQEMRTRGGGGEGDLGGNNLHCGLCENGKLLSFWFSFHSAYCRKIFKDHVLSTRVDIGVVSWLDQSRINFFTMIQINIIQYLQLNG